MKRIIYLSLLLTGCNETTPKHKAVDLSELSFSNTRSPLSADERLLEATQLPVAHPGSVTLLWTYPQFSQTWGQTFTVLHSSDLKTWTTLTNFSLPKYHTAAIWTHTNDDFGVTLEMRDHDFFRVGVNQ